MGREGLFACLGGCTRQSAVNSFASGWSSRRDQQILSCYREEESSATYKVTLYQYFNVECSPEIDDLSAGHQSSNYSE